MKSVFGSLTGLAFGSWLDRRLVRDEIGVWIGVWFVMKSAFGSLTGLAFGSLADRRLVCLLIGVWIVLSLARSLFWLAEFFFSLALSFFCAWKETV